MLKTLKVSELQPGMLVSKVVSQHGPVKIRKVGMIRGPEMIKGLTEMGVTEVEVDLSQSLGLDDNTDERSVGDSDSQEQKNKLTPTQQLLQNERQTAKANTETNQQYNRSLFMPSMDSLPSTWDLYGKNVFLLIFLVIGGVCVGWNIAQFPNWLELTRTRDYVVIDYQPTNQATNIVAQRAKQSSEQEIEDEKTTQADETTIAQNTNAQEKNAQSKTETYVAEPEEKPIILGYQPENMQALNDDNNTSTQIKQQSGNETSANKADNIINAPSTNAADPAVSAALLEKINKAIADLDNNDGGDSAARLTNNYDDLPRVDQLSVAIQTQIPSMTFSAHMYSSNRDGRWVRVNGRRLVEGDYIAENLQLVNIEPQKVILSFNDEVFTMNALSDW
jgi:general secretion pathway protein B